MVGHHGDRRCRSLLDVGQLRARVSAHTTPALSPNGEEAISARVA